jgi:hypothetical protein
MSHKHEKKDRHQDPNSHQEMTAPQGEPTSGEGTRFFFVSCNSTIAQTRNVRTMQKPLRKST